MRYSRCGLLGILCALIPASLSGQRLLRVVPSQEPAPFPAPLLNPPPISQDLYTVASGEHHSWRIGLVVGAVLGAVAGGLAGNTSCRLDSSPPCGGATVRGAAVGMVIGGALGVFVGSLFDRD